MSKKSWEAILIGVALWVAGTVLLIVFGNLSMFPSVVPAATLLLVPLLIVLTRVHLRGVPTERRLATGLRLSILTTAVQCPLDALLLLSIFRLDYPDLSLPAQRSTVFVLLIGYFCLLVVPWSVSAREQAV